MSSYDERAAESYDELYRHELAEAEDAAALLAELAGPGPALELGVGTGRLAVPLARQGVNVHGIDSSEAMVERLRAKHLRDRWAGWRRGRFTASSARHVSVYEKR